MLSANLPMWVMGLRCALTAAASLTVAGFVSRYLSQQADKQDEGDDLAMDASMSVDEDQWNALTIDRENDFKDAIHAFWVALHRPMALFVPIIAAVYSLKEVESLLRALLVHHISHGALTKMQKKALEGCLNGFTVVDRLFQEVDQLVLIMLGVWVMLRFKDRLVQLLTVKGRRAHAKAEAKISGKGGYRKSLKTVNTMERVLLPFSSLASWLLVAVGGLMAMHVVGINIQPLLTVGGVSGVIVGFSAQSVMANLIAGVNVFLSQPFVVGERVSLMGSGGSTAFTGTVEAVYPMRTILRDDTSTPFVLPNKVLSDMIVKNESRVAHSHVVSSYGKMRALNLTISLRYQDFPRVEAVMDEFRDILRQNATGPTPEVDKAHSIFVGLRDFDKQALNIVVHVQLTPAGSRSFGSYRTRLLLQLGRTIEDMGACLAVPVAVMADADENLLTSGHAKSSLKSARDAAQAATKQAEEDG